MRWGFIGASNIAERVAGSLRKLPGQTFVGVCSRSAERAAQFAREQGFASHHTELSALLALGLDAVYISSTNEQHHAQTMAALAAGCHVMCEKPIAMTRAHAAEMVEAARRAGRVMGTNHHLRAQATHQAMRQMIADGKIGRVHGVQVSHAVFLPPHLQGWRLSAPEAGGGVVLDILVHDADLLRYLLGREARRITTVTQRNGMAEGTLEDGAMNLIEFDDGILAQTHESFVARDAMTRLHVLGTEGSLYAEGSLSQAGEATLSWRHDGIVEQLPMPKVDLYEVGFSAFVRACAGDGQPLATGADGERSMAIALAGLESAASGQARLID